MKNHTVSLGLDLSLTGPGIVVAAVEPSTFAEVLRARYPRTKPLDKTHSETGKHGAFFYGTDEERIDYIKKMIVRTIKRHDIKLVGIEQYAFSRHSRSLTGLHELGGVVKNWLFAHGVHFEVVESTSLKKFATGKGTTSKDKHEMIEAAWGFGFTECPPKNHDLADAYHCARFAAYRQSGAINQ